MSEASFSTNRPRAGTSEHLQPVRKRHPSAQRVQCSQSDRYDASNDAPVSPSSPPRPLLLLSASQPSPPLRKGHASNTRGVVIATSHLPSGDSGTGHVSRPCDTRHLSPLSERDVRPSRTARVRPSPHTPSPCRSAVQSIRSGASYQVTPQRRPAAKRTKRARDFERERGRKCKRTRLSPAPAPAPTSRGPTVRDVQGHDESDWSDLMTSSPLFHTRPSGAASYALTAASSPPCVSPLPDTPCAYGTTPPAESTFLLHSLTRGDATTALTRALERRLQVLHRSPSPTHPLSVFYSIRPPPVTTRDYVRRLVRYTHCSPTCFVVALVYVDRLSAAHARLQLATLNVHRLLITAIMLAVKMLDDRAFSTAHYARVGGVPTACELARVELAFLRVLRYDLFVSPSQYEHALCDLLQPPSAPLCLPAALSERKAEDDEEEEDDKEDGGDDEGEGEGEGEAVIEDVRGRVVLLRKGAMAASGTETAAVSGRRWVAMTACSSGGGASRARDATYTCGGDGGDDGDGASETSGVGVRQRQRQRRKRKRTTNDEADEGKMHDGMDECDSNMRVHKRK